MTIQFEQGKHLQIHIIVEDADEATKFLLGWLFGNNTTYHGCKIQEIAWKDEEKIEQAYKLLGEYLCKDERY